jgi:hypothetical protein
MAPEDGFFGGTEPALADFFVLEAAEAVTHLIGTPAGDFLDSLPRLGPLCGRLRQCPAIRALWASGARPGRLTGRPDEAEVVQRLRSADWADAFR